MGYAHIEHETLPKIHSDKSQFFYTLAHPTGLHDALDKAYAIQYSNA
jgi:hypothetical protein